MKNHFGIKHAALPLMAASLMFSGCNTKDEALSGPAKESTLPVAAQIAPGKADIVLYDNSNGLWTAAKSNGSAFVPTGVAWMTYAIGTVFDVVPADVNGDGKDDLVLRNKVTSQILVAVSNGSTYAAPANWLSSWVSGSNYVLLAGDVNADGKEDIIAKNTTNASWRVALSTGSAFTNSGDWITTFANGAGYDVFVADVDHDLRVDLVAHDQVTGALLYARNAGGIFLSQGQVGTSIASSGTSTAFLVADVTGDGKADFISKSGTGDWKVNQSTGYVFQTGVTWGTGFAVGSGYFLYARDVTGDGKADLIARDRISANTGRWFVFQSNGSQFVNGAIWLDNYGPTSNYTGFIADASGN